MSLPSGWRRVFRLPFTGRHVERDVDEELAFHLAMREEQLRRAGLPTHDAAARARERFGDAAAIRDECITIDHQHAREARLMEWLQSIRSDLHYAGRTLRRTPVFTGVAVLTLALGIGANSAIFSVVYSVLLRPLPYAHAERLLELRERNGAGDRSGMVVSYGNYATWAREARAFDAFGAISGGPSLTLTGAGDPLGLRVNRASAGYWQALHIPPAAGRYFTAADDRPGAPNVVVLSHFLWRSRFGGEPRVVGQSITLSGVPYTVVGVAAAEYALSPQAVERPTVWVPLALTAADEAEHADHELNVYGRVREGVTAERALAELTSIETRLAREYPNSYFDGNVIATPLRDAVVGPVRSIVLLLFGAVGLVLLIACANVANLLLARAAAREKELAVRSALGAGRGRIARQLLTESMVLALAGSAGGVVVAAAGVRLLVRSAPRNVPRLQDVGLHLPVLAFTVALGVACGLAFGLAPALRAARPALRDALGDGARGSGAAARAGLRGALVVAQVAVALVLLVGAGLLVRSATNLQRVAPGFETRNLLTTAVALPEAQYASAAAEAAAFAQIEAAAAALPGVRSAGLVSRIPIASFGMDCPVRLPGAAPGDEHRITTNIRKATPTAFAALGVPLLRGRGFTAADRAGALPVVVINRALARRLFGPADPIGQRIATCVGGSVGNSAEQTVVGLIGDMRARGLDSESPPEAYFPYAQAPERRMILLLRGGGDVTTLVPALRRAVAAVDPLLPLSDIATMEEIVARSLSVPRFTTLLLLLLGGTGLVLAVIGIYGVIAYLVAQRTREIGIRLALGATPGGVVRLVVRQGVALALAGVAIGLGASWVLVRVVEQQLFQVSAHDPVTFAGVGALLVSVAVAASALPAWRAARVDPSTAIRGA